MDRSVSKLKQLDWETLRLLPALVRAPTLRAGAAKAGASAATLVRRLNAIERVLGQKLFERTQTGCTPTPAGLRAVRLAERMGELAADIAALSDAGGPEGVVRINADEWISYFLTTRMAGFRARHPRVEVEILTSHRPYSLSRREADIALRPFRPEGGDVTVRRIGRFRFGLYAERSYARDRAQAIAARDWRACAFVGFDEERAGFAAERWLRALPGAPAPWLRCSYALGIYDGVARGAGLGVLAHFIAQDSPDLVPVLADIPDLDQDIWLSRPRASQGAARFDAVCDFIIAAFAGPARG